MTITTTTDIYAVIADLYPALSILTGDLRTALVDALAKPSPVDTVSDALEALFAAVKGDTLTGADLTTVVAACNQTAFLCTTYQWHGKTQRGADISAAMNAIDGGTAVATACNSVEVDPRFAPAPAAADATSAA